MAVVEDEMLSEAVQRDDLPAIHDALAKGANPNSWVPVHHHLVVAAAHNGSAGAVEALLGAGSNPLATDPDGRGIYHHAAMGIALEDHRRAALVRSVKDVGPDPDDPDKFGHTAMGIAVVNDLASVIHALAVDCGAELDLPDAAGNTPLHIAAGKGHADALYMLLVLGADAAQRNADGLTPAELAEQLGKEDAKQAIARFEALSEIDPETVEPGAKAFANPKFWQKAEAVFDAWRQRGVTFDAEMLNLMEAPARHAPCQMARLCGKVEQTLGFLMEQAPLEPRHLRGAEGAPTALQNVLTEGGHCAQLFDTEQWQGREANAFTALFSALEPEGRGQVGNFYQLREELRGQSREESRGR